MATRHSNRLVGDARLLSPPTTIDELCDRYMDWARTYYRKPDGRPTSEASTICCALAALRAVAGPLPPDQLRAEHICQAQRWLIGRGLARKSINAYIRKIRAAMRWAAKPPQRWVGPLTIADIDLAEQIAPHRSPAPETPGVKPVSWELVSSTIAVAPMELATMIELHWWTGMRPGELVAMKKSELAEHGDVIIYTPAHHKTEHRGFDRQIAIGPNGAAVLRPWLARVSCDKIFRFVTACGYRRAVARLNKPLGISWNPNQIRHAAATRIRAVSGLDAAQVVLGHRRASTTELYAELDLARAIDVQRRHG